MAQYPNSEVPPLALATIFQSTPLAVKTFVLLSCEYSAFHRVYISPSILAVIFHITSFDEVFVIVTSLQNPSFHSALTDCVTTNAPLSCGKVSAELLLSIISYFFSASDTVDEFSSISFIIFLASSTLELFLLAKTNPTAVLFCKI